MTRYRACMTVLPQEPAALISTARRAARNVRAEAARNGMTQHDLAELLALSQSAISDRYRGRTPFTLDELDLLAVAFRMTVPELISGQRNSPDPDPMIMTDCSRLASTDRYNVRPIRATIRHFEVAA